MFPSEDNTTTFSLPATKGQLLQMWSGAEMMAQLNKLISNSLMIKTVKWYDELPSYSKSNGINITLFDAG